MKKITVISSFLLACVASSCRNEDVYVAEDARQAKYNQEWVNKYGPIDPNQTFNMAETKDMSITVSEDSNVKIYFESDGKRFIAADYQLKSGTTSVKFDVPAGVECIQVIKDSPKRTAQSIFTAVKPHMEISFSEEICMSRVGEEEVPANAIREIKLDTPSLTLPNCYVLTAEATGSTNSITSQLPHDVFWDVYSTDSSMPFMAEENRNDYKNLESYHGIGDIVFETTGGPVSITYLGGKTQQKPSLGYFYLPDEDFEKLNGMSNLDERNELLNSYKRYHCCPEKIRQNSYY